LARICAARSISGRPRVRIRRFRGARPHNRVFVNPRHAPLPPPFLPLLPPLQACPQLVRVKCHRDRDAAPRGVVILGTALLINNANPPPAPPPLRLLLPAVVSRASRFPLSPPLPLPSPFEHPIRAMVVISRE